MTKVCHMTSVHTSTDTRIFHKECVSLAGAGYEVYLVAPGESREDKGVHVIGVGTKPASRLKRMTEITKKVYTKALELDCDIYHFHDPELLPYGAKLKKHGKKVIFDIHEDIFDYIDEKAWIPRFVRPVISFFANQYFRHVLPKLNGLITVTPHLYDKLYKLNHQTVLVTNYPQLTEEGSKTSCNHASNDSFQLVFAGGVTKQWSHEQITEAVQPIPNANYHIYGRVSAPYRETIKGKDSFNKVYLHGQVSHVEAKQALMSADVGMALCVPGKNTNYREGSLGNTKLFEYMMSGLPVICTDFTLWKEIVEKYQCGICVEPDNIDEISSAIKYLLDNPGTAQRMGMNGRKAVVDEYNWDIVMKELLSLYANI